jgi:hypothetical protein
MILVDYILVEQQVVLLLPSLIFSLQSVIYQFTFTTWTPDITVIFLLAVFCIEFIEQIYQCIELLDCSI